MKNLTVAKRLALGNGKRDIPRRVEALRSLSIGDGDGVQKNTHARVSSGAAMSSIQAGSR